MKNRLFFFKMLLFVALMATWTSCSKSDDIEASDPKPVNPTPTNPTNPTDKTDPKDDPYMVVCEHVEKVAKSVDTYYDQCHSMEELKQHLDDIKKIEYVENVTIDGPMIFVEIKDYGTISYSYFLKPKLPTAEEAKSFASYTNKIIKKAGSSPLASHNLLEIKSIGICFQMFNDEDWNFAVPYLEGIQKQLNSHGFRVSRIIEPTVEFFQDEIFDYDVMLILTHGGYFKKLHWLLTSTPLSVGANASLLQADQLYYYRIGQNTIPQDQIMFHKHQEIHNGKKQTVWHALISEKWIANSSKNFSGDNPIVFNGACLSMKGIEKGDTVGYSLAKVFTSKGAAAYFGYDEETYANIYSIYSFSRGLLSGRSLESVYNHLPFSAIHNFVHRLENGTVVGPYWADLIPYYNPTINGIKESCIISPKLTKLDDNSSDTELSITLHGSSIYYDDDFSVNDNKPSYYNFATRIPYNAPFLYGFYLSTTKDLKDAYQVCVLNLNDDDCYYSMSTNIIRFDYTLTYKPLVLGCMIAPETTYYYWAYFYDGHDYYLSDMDSFTTGSLKDTGNSGTNTSGQGNLPNVPGSDL